MASELRVNTLKDASGNNSIATSFVANGSGKFWVRWTEIGTSAIGDSFNAASITDNGTGDTTFAFTSSLGNTNYCLGVSNSSAEVNNSQTGLITSATASVRMETRSGADNSSLDTSNNSCMIMGDLA
jgi:hypothetical protein